MKQGRPEDIGGINLRYEDASGLASSHSGVTKLSKCPESKRQSFFAPHFGTCGQYWAFWKLFSIEAFAKMGCGRCQFCGICFLNCSI